MKNVVITIFFSLCYANLIAQPLGTEKLAAVYLNFVVNKDTLSFDKNNNEYNAAYENDKYKISFFVQQYIPDMKSWEEYKEKFLQELKKDSTTKWDYKDKYVPDSAKIFDARMEGMGYNIHPIGDKIFMIGYIPSNREIGTNEIIPSTDIIILFEKNNRKMKIYLKLYNAKPMRDNGSKVYMSISFQEGIFEVTDPENPKLVAVKEDDEFQ